MFFEERSGGSACFEAGDALTVDSGWLRNLEKKEDLGGEGGGGGSRRHWR